jgi:hypothetical protein
LAATVTLAGLVLSNTLHHLGACGACCRLHHITAWGFASTAPDGLATHGDGFTLLARLRSKAVNDLHRNVLFGKALNVLHEAFFIQAH